MVGASSDRALPESKASWSARWSICCPNVEILREHAVVFMGADSTTGYGKSTIARFLAAKFAVHMTTVLNRPKTEATVLSSTTLDDLSGVSCRSGWAVMLDELDVGDKDAI